MSTHSPRKRIRLASTGEGSDIPLVNVLEKDFFPALLGPYLLFADLRSLSLTSKATGKAIGKLVRTWPEEIQELLRTWSGQTPRVGAHYRLCRRHHRNGIEYRHPIPIVRFHFDALAYDKVRKVLTGQPWSDVGPIRGQPLNLGRIEPSMCSANDSGTKIFYCGGCAHPNEDSNEDVESTPSSRRSRRRRRRWIREQDMLGNGFPESAAIFDTETMSWTQLPPMPECRCGAGMFRVGSKIYVIGGRILRGRGDTLCFDLDQRRWIDSGCSDFPVDRHDAGIITAVVVNKSRVIVAGGNMGESRRAFSLNTNTGTWTPLPDLPECARTMPSCYLHEENKQSGGSAVFFALDNDWARLSPSGQWDISPDLCGCKMRMVRSSQDKSEIFAGNKWVALPPLDGALQYI